MEQVLFIVWRESVEAMLVVGILYTWLRSTPEGKRGLNYLWGGVAAGLALAVALALVLLAFVGLFKFPDQVIGVMAGPFYLDSGFDKADIATVSKLFGV
ncbi:hypothetical protein G6F21_014335 [Rhizopus arrhizus]|nr:hypothetical protein G6F21_014335 [Rhizopus arrhizus]